MHHHEQAGHTEAGSGRTPAHNPASALPTQQRGLLGLQAGAGNAAVVQMLRQAGHPGAQERHQHAAGCGHQHAGQEPAPRSAPQPAVQRSAVHDVLRTPGRPLDGTTRADMEARLGADFSDVRIHSDAAAKASAAEVGARAYTSGHHVVIGDGGADRHTLAHELTHVIQQRQGPVAGADNGSGLKVSDPSDRFEREAEANAVRAMAARPQDAQHLQRDLAPAHAPVALSAVQRAYDHDNPANPQNVMTTEHWERQAGVMGADGKATKEMATAKVSLTNAAKKNKKAKAGKVRTMEEIIKTVGPDLLRQLQSKPATAGKLELYRSMSLGEAMSIVEYWGSPAQAAALQYVADGEGSAKEFKTHHKGMTIGAHLGDRAQADAYHNMGGEAYQVMLKFTLKPGAHELLFHPQHMALGPSYHSELIRKAHGGDYQNANANEGALPGYIGVKAEENEPFSMAVAQGAKSKKGREAGPSQLLFQLFVEDVNVVGNKSGTPLPGEAVAAV
ncbi:eCIS core domain-containing protein [Streptomyces sp. CA2R101]|uniref:eCIS core domain-containing protein n=1 Tax=Streptomyces sp. CA2R101 TaxID=3120152 RepID=UPI003009FAB3